jgi:4-amino-4-deoxy-L-arabinose transferase-like glycosyltransferase
MSQTVSTPKPIRSSSPESDNLLASKRSSRTVGSYLISALLVTGILIRLLVVIIPGNGIQAPWSGGGDAHAYITLAENIVAGQGYSYHGFPSAFRPPLYPGTLVLFMKLLGGNAFRGVRFLQFFEGLAAVFLCGAAAGRIFGKSARNATIVIALFFPMLVALSGEIQTETLATLFSSAFLYLLIRFMEQQTWAVLVALAAITGAATLCRSNMVLFGFILVGVIFLQKGGLPKIRSAVLATLVAGLVISPWVIRNRIVFHGEVFLSTQSGINAAATMVTPQGRTQLGDIEKLKEVLGWVPPEELETNTYKRLTLPSEPELNRQGWDMARKLWREAGWKLVPLATMKISYFWLGTDQLIVNSSFRVSVRVARQGAVLVYWGFLLLGIVGWFHLRVRKPAVAWLFLFYAMLITVLHLPFAMNTRIGVPFIDPLVAILAGTGVLQVAARLPFIKRQPVNVTAGPQTT